VGEMRNEYKILAGKSEGMKALGRSGPRWRDNIKIDQKKYVGVCVLDSCGSGYEEMVSSCEHGNELSSIIEGGEFFK
jgi:hypothetical protein